MPLAAAEAIAREGGGIARDIGRIGALATWRVTQGVYRFDPTLYENLVSTPLTGTIPVEIFSHLPEWCIYIETPGFYFIDDFLPGFFTHLEDDQNGGPPELRLLLDTTEGFIPAVIHLMPGASVLDGMKQTFLEAEAVGKATGNDYHVNVTEADFEHASRRLGELLNLVLYVCSSGADLPFHGLNRPFPKKIKGGYRYFPPDKPKVWDVGYRIGAAIRAAQSKEQSESQGGTHASPRPHIRRAHWHSFWTGPKRGVLKVYWLPPIPVGVQEIEGLIPVVREISPE